MIGACGSPAHSFQEGGGRYHGEEEAAEWTKAAASALKKQCRVVPGKRAGESDRNEGGE